MWISQENHQNDIKIWLEHHLDKKIQLARFVTLHFAEL